MYQVKGKWALITGAVRAALDIDSPVRNRFDAEDRAGLERLVRMMEERVKWD